MAISMKAARVNANLTQTEAAEKLGISKNTLMNYEMRRTKPSVEMAENIAKLYGLPVYNIDFF